MKRRKCRYVDQRDIEACIDQLQAVIDGLRSGSMALEEEDQSLLLRPRGLLDFELRVEQLETKETLRLEMSWRLQRGAEAGGAPPSGPREVLDRAVWDGPITAWPRSERPALERTAAEAPSSEPLSVEPLSVEPLPDSAAMDSVLERATGECGCAARWSEDPISGWPPPRPVVAEYHQLYADACTMGSDGQWHIDRDQLVQSLARAGVDPLTQQDLYSFALQADLDRTSWFSERVIAALERASQRPMAAVG